MRQDTFAIYLTLSSRIALLRRRRHHTGIPPLARRLGDPFAFDELARFVPLMYACFKEP